MAFTTLSPPWKTIGLVIVPTPVFELVTVTDAVTPARIACVPAYASVVGFSRDASIRIDVLAENVVVEKLFTLRMKPDGCSVTSVVEDP